VWPLRTGILILFALLYTGLNALIPLQIDDAAYVCYARQAAMHPRDPYGFAILWYDVPDAANNLLAPPVLPYSIAPAVLLCGERPALWKLALLPWALLFAFVLHAHLRRFAPGLELELTAFLLFSPALLPSLNLMLDVPALALALLAVFLFLRACDSGSVTRAVLAGLVAAVAMQTKYTGITAIGALAGAAVVYRRPGLGVAAAVTAAVGFIAWEVLVASLYGRSHFLNALEANDTSLADRVNLIPVFFGQIGGVAAPVVLLGLAANGSSGRRLLVAGGTVLAGYAAVALLDARYTGVVNPSPRFFGAISAPPWRFQLAELLFDVFAGVGVVALVGAVRRLSAENAGRGRSNTAFLLTWLGVEAAGYLLLTPFPAVRRVLGVYVVLTVVFGRLASRTCTTPGRRLLVRGIVGFGAILGLSFLGIDWLGARAYQRGAEEAAALVRDHGGGRVWYSGRWGFRYYAERSAMLPVVPRYDADRPGYLKLPPPSRLRSGDWLVVAEDYFQKPALDFSALPREEVNRVVIDDPLPLQTVPCFYGGRTPLEHHEGPRLVVDIYRVTENCQVDLLPATNAGP
jgi:hypothetical protein